MPNEMRTVRGFSPLKWVLITVLLPACVLGGCQRQVSDKRIEVIGLEEAVEYFERSKGEDSEALFFDARRDSIYAEGTIEGAVQLRPDDVDLRAGPDPRYEARDALIVFGQNPGSAVARAMSKRLIEAGYNSMLKSRVKFYPGGYDEWLATGLPTEVPKVED